MIADEFEEIDRKSMVELVHLHDFSIPMHENHAYLGSANEMRKQREVQLRGDTISEKTD